MILTSSNTLESKEIIEYKGLVTGESLIGANIYKDLFSEWRQTEIGLFSKTYGYIKTYVVLKKTVSNNLLSCLVFN